MITESEEQVSGKVTLVAVPAYSLDGSHVPLYTVGHAKTNSEATHPSTYVDGKELSPTSQCCLGKEHEEP